MQARLGPRARSALAADLRPALRCSACGVLAWQFARFEMSSWRFGDVAPSYLATPLWLPRLAMALGMLALCFSLCRTVIVEAKPAVRTLLAGGKRDVA